jgi:Spy/CpxP family protein refolding chaperone
MKQIFLLLPAVAVLIVFTVSYGYGQEAQTQPPAQNAQAGAQMGDLIRELNLTPEQREQIRAIRQQSKDERAAINASLKETRRALTEALDADNPDEALVERRMRDLAAAQAAAMRMSIENEIKIRRVLTIEQRNTLRVLRQQAANQRRDRIMNSERERRREERILQNQRNGLGPLFPGQRVQRRRPRL